MLINTLWYLDIFNDGIENVVVSSVHSKTKTKWRRLVHWFTRYNLVRCINFTIKFRFNGKWQFIVHVALLGYKHVQGGWGVGEGKNLPEEGRRLSPLYDAVECLDGAHLSHQLLHQAIRTSSRHVYDHPLSLHHEYKGIQRITKEYKELQRSTEDYKEVQRKNRPQHSYWI